MTPQEKLQYLIAHPDELIKKKPFTRGSDRFTQKRENDVAAVGDVQPALLPDYERSVISQARFLAELDPACHDVLFDDNIPSITAKIGDNQYVVPVVFILPPTLAPSNELYSSVKTSSYAGTCQPDGHS